MNVGLIRFCVCVCLSVRIAHTLSKIKFVTNYVRRFWHLLSNSVTAKMALRDIDLPFRGKVIKIRISLKRQELALKCVEDICRFWHLPSNGVFAKIVLRDLDLLFNGETLIFLYIWNICTFWRLTSNSVIATFAFSDFDLPFEDKRVWNFYISETVRANAKRVWDIYGFWALPSNDVIFENCTPWPWHIFWRSKIYLFVYLKHTERLL